MMFHYYKVDFLYLKLSPLSFQEEVIEFKQPISLVKNDQQEILVEEAPLWRQSVCLYD